MTTVANVLINVGYRLFPDGTAISTTSQPSQAECIQWINETCQEIQTVCIELGSEIGRTTPATITLVDGTSSYSDLTATLLAPVLYKDESGRGFSAWIEKTNERIPLKLLREQDLINYNPTLEREPVGFYIDGANNLIFVPTPDAAYTVKMPHYAHLTALTLTTNTIPFLNIFDLVITESVTMRAQNRDEYELGFELKWYGYIRDQARKIILTRKNPVTRIVV
jgi:hypothetical protein